MRVTVTPIVTGSVQSPKDWDNDWRNSKRTSGDYPNCNIVEIGQNTEKRPGHSRRLAVTSEKLSSIAGGKNSRNNNYNNKDMSSINQ